MSTPDPCPHPARVHTRPVARSGMPPVPASSPSIACSRTPRPEPLPISPGPRLRALVVVKLMSLVTSIARICRPAQPCESSAPQPSSPSHRAAPQPSRADGPESAKIRQSHCVGHPPAAAGRGACAPPFPREQTPFFARRTSSKSPGTQPAEVITSRPPFKVGQPTHATLNPSSAPGKPNLAMCATLGGDAGARAPPLVSQGIFSP